MPEDPRQCWCFKFGWNSLPGDPGIAKGFMSTWNISGCAVLTAVFITGLAGCSRGPYGTALPLDLADIPKIQPQLNKLPDDERELVLGYLRRSNGDVLPAKFADPDAPFTARTFAEAIKLQKDYKVKHAVDIARMDALQAAREAALAPLRDALSIELVSREILSADAVSGRELIRGQAINDSPILVTTYRLRNRTYETITDASGSVVVRTSDDPKSLMGAARCWFQGIERLSPGQATEVRCGDIRKQVDDASKAFVALPESALILTWEPKSITFESGKVLKAENN